MTGGTGTGRCGPACGDGGGARKSFCRASGILDWTVGGGATAVVVAVGNGEPPWTGMLSMLFNVALGPSSCVSISSGAENTSDEDC